VKDFSSREPGIWRHTRVTKTGVVLYDTKTSASENIFIRTSTGYTGAKPKVRPRPKHAYTFNQQRNVLTHRALYKYTNGDVEEAYGAGLAATINGATLLPIYDWSSLQNQALDKLTKLTRGDLDLSIDLAEAGKTLKMLKLTDQVVEMTQLAAKRFGPIRVLSSGWLAWQYGVRPLLGSIFGLADESIRIVINKTERHTARATGTYMPKFVNVNAVVGSVDFPVPVQKPVKVSVTYGVDLRSSQFDLARFTSLNPLSIAWELTPFSFVADWFFNLGGYLRNMETALLYGNKFNSGYRTRLAVGQVAFRLADVGVGAGEVSHSSIWGGSTSFTSIERTILTAYPAPSFPSFEAKLGSSRMLSAAALLGGLLGKR